MGYIRHHAIVVTSWSNDHIERAHAKAKELGMTVIGPSAEAANGYRSILICPDGSKEGWDWSDDGDNRRDAFVAYLATQVYSDGSSALEWFEAEYGADDKIARTTRCAWD